MKTKTKNIFKKLAALCLGLTMTFGAISGISVKAQEADATATSYSLVFKTGTGDGSSVSTSTNSSELFSSGSDYVTGTLVTATKVYYSGSSGLKLGTSSDSGTLKFNLSNSGKVTPTSIVVNAKRYSSTKATKLQVNGSSAQNLTSDFADYTFSITSEITYIELKSSKGTSGGAYCWIKSIIVIYNGSNNECNHSNKTEHGAKDATCTTVGNEAYYTCNECDAIFASDRTTILSAIPTIPMLAHSYGDWVDDAQDDEQHYKTCSNCGDIVKENHIYDEGEVVTEATKSEVGSIKYTCSVCGHEKLDVLPILVDKISLDITSNDSTSKSGITVSFAKGSGTTSPASQNSRVRLYPSNTITVSSTNKAKMVKIEFTVYQNSTKNLLSFSPSTGAMSNSISTSEPYIWIGSGDSVVFTLANTTGYQTEVGNVSIVLESTSVDDRTLKSITLSGTYQTEFELNEEFNSNNLIVYASYEEDGVEDRDVSSEVDVSSPDMTSVGEKNITVTYTENSIEKSEEYSIWVKSKLSSIDEESFSFDEATKTLSWTAVDNATGYLVKVGENEGVNVNTNSYVFNSIEYATKYSGEVTAISSSSSYMSSEAASFEFTTSVAPLQDGTYKLILTGEDFKSGGYSANNGVNYFNVTSSDTNKTGSVGFNVADVYQNGGIQIKKTTGLIESFTNLGTLVSVTFVNKTNSATYTFKDGVLSISGDNAYCVLTSITIDFVIGTAKTYKWLDTDGSTVLKEVTQLASTEVPTFDKTNPTKDAETYTSYTFNGWSSTESDGVVTYTPNFSSNHIHSGTKVQAVAATCTAAGNIEYYQCQAEGCGKYFSDAACTKEITLASTVIGALGHNYGEPNYLWNGSECTATKVCTRDSSHKVIETVTGVFVEDTPATCSNPQKGHYIATFEDTSFEQQTTAANSAINNPALDHSLEYVSANPATCESDGTIAYYHCSECGKNFSDSEGTVELNSIVDPKHNHEMTYHPAVAATTTSEGNVEYWSCSECGKNYADSEGKVVLDSVITERLSEVAASLDDGSISFGGSSVLFDTVNIVAGKAMATPEDGLLFIGMADSGQVLTSIEIDLGDVEFEIYARTADMAESTYKKVVGGAFVGDVVTRGIKKGVTPSTSLPEGVVEIRVEVSSEITEPVEVKALTLSSKAAKTTVDFVTSQKVYLSYDYTDGTTPSVSNVKAGMTFYFDFDEGALDAYIDAGYTFKYYYNYSDSALDAATLKASGKSQNATVAAGDSQESLTIKFGSNSAGQYDRTYYVAFVVLDSDGNIVDSVVAHNKLSDMWSAFNDTDTTNTGESLARDVIGKQF